MTDIVRITPDLPVDAFYLFAYLQTPTAQALIRRGRTGTSIDHLSSHDVERILVVWLGDRARQDISACVERAERQLDDARESLDRLDAELHRRAGLPPVVPGPGSPDPNGPRTFATNASDLSLRLDAEFYAPRATSARAAVKASGAERLDVAANLTLLGRYKRYYVTAGHGRPILSGRQLLQLRPVNLQYISDRSFADPDKFVVQAGWTLFTIDGRAEEALGTPAYVHSGWDGWMASNHVMRAIPRPGLRAGYLYVALRSPYVQLQLKSRATGSVVDALDKQAVCDVLLPMLSQADCDELGEAAEQAWNNVAEALRLQDIAVAEIEESIRSGYEARARRESTS